MAKDPFKDLPAIEPDEHHEHGAAAVPDDHVEASEDVSAGTPPRTLLKSATKWAMPLMGIAIFAWLFMPQDQTTARRATSAPVEVDATRQANDTTAMMKSLKEDAAKKPVVAVPIMPGSTPAQNAAISPHSGSQTNAPGALAATGTYTPATARPPLPPGYVGAPTMPTPLSDPKADERAAAAATAQLTRQQEVRASAIEVGTVRLIGDSGNGSSTSAAPAVPPALAGLQGDLVEAAKAEATRGQMAMQDRVLAAMAPKETPKSKGANEDFLAANTMAANSTPHLTRQMAPQASGIVNEGHVIRTVLLTNVSSDLPGRVLARVTSDVYDSQQQHVVIPKGSQIIGVYSNQVVVGQERLLLAMNRLILPNGSWISLSGAGATDMMGMSGLKADVNNHFMKMFGSSLVIGASTLLMPRADTTVTALQGASGTGTPTTAGSIFATSLSEVLKNLLERNRQISPTLSLQAGEEFIFVVTQDMAMIPYQP
jgi:type IV secretion system protein TrbI